MLNIKKIFEASITNSEKVSFEQYEKMDKSTIQQSSLIPPDPLDFNDYGKVLVIYKNPVWKG